MVSVGLYETPFSTMLPGHNGFGGPFYPHSQYHQDYFPQHFGQFPTEAVNSSQSWLPYQTSRHSTTTTTNTASCPPDWSFPQTSNFLSTNNTTQTYRDSCLELEQPITVSTDNLPGSPQSAIISSTHSPGENSPKSCSRYTCYDWSKSRPDSSPSDPLPNKWKTRTKDKYRVVYTDRQRLELEKEFHYSRYITINRKAELSKTLDLSERQIKIWFQNRRAKERKINKKKGSKQSSEEKESCIPSIPVSMPNLQNMTSLAGQSMTSLRRDDQYTPVGNVMGYQPPHPVTYHGSMIQNMNLGYGAMKSSLDLNSGFVKSEYPHQ